MKEGVGMFDRMQAALSQAHSHLSLPAGQLAGGPDKRGVRNPVFPWLPFCSLLVRMLQKSHSPKGKPDSMRVELYTKQREKNFFNFFFLLFLQIYNHLIFKNIFFAFRIGILLEAAPMLVLLPVNRLFSTKFSTDFVDSGKRLTTSGFIKKQENLH